MAPQHGCTTTAPAHPLRPERVLLTWELLEAYGLTGTDGVAALRCGARRRTRRLLLVHTPEFIDATRRAGHGEDGPWGRFGYGPGDNPIFDRMHEAAAIVVGATVAAAAARPDRGRRARVQRGRRPAPRDAGPRVGLLRLRRPRRRDRVDARRRASSASPTSTSTCITATVRRRSSTTTLACSRSRSTSTRPNSGSSPAPARPTNAAVRRPGTRRSTCRWRRARTTTAGSRPSATRCRPPFATSAPTCS